MADQVVKVIKRPNHRPPTYNKEFHPDDYIAESKNGKTRTQIAAKWEMYLGTLKVWERQHKEFGKAVRIGKVYCKSFWINFAFLAMIGKAKMNGEPVTIDFKYFNWIMMNCFGIGKDKKVPIINIEFKRILEAAEQLKTLPQAELIKLAEIEIAKAKE